VAPGLDAALAALDAEDRAAVLRMLAALGMEAVELACVPPLRQLVSLMATLRLASAMDLPRAVAFDEGAHALGLNGASLLRSWHRWQASAARQFVIEDDEVA
jgi:hypothetical protein